MTAEIVDLFQNDNGRFPRNWPYTINGTPVNPPRSSKDFLELCKEFLQPEDYTDMCVGIMDDDAYAALELPMRKLIDNYYWFMGK